MNLIELSELLLDENLAEQYLLKHNILKTFTHCNKCKCNRLSKISRGRYRCNSCESEWSGRKDSILYKNQLSYSKFIGIVKCFTLELPAIQTSDEIQLNKIKVQRLYNLFRAIIIGAELLDERTLANTLKSDSPTFSITIVDDIVTINFADAGITNQDLFTVKRTRVPNREASFNFYHGNINARSVKNKLSEMPISQNHFWRYANVKLQSFRGTKTEHLFQYLKEIEFRYNNRDGNLFDKLVANIAHFEGWR